MIKTSGAEFKRFYSDDTVWPEGAWHEDETLLVDGDEWDEDYGQIPDNAKVTLSGGTISFDLTEAPDVSMETHFRNWRKRQTTTTILVECDMAKIDEIKAAVKAAGGRVI